MTGVGGYAVLLLLIATIPAGCDRATNPAPGKTEPDQHTLRVITLSPNLAELVYAVGAGDLLVGVSAYTDYPPEAAALPVVGDAFNLDQEQLALLEPGLLLAWDTGTPAHVVDELRRRGYRVEIVTTTHLADIGQALLKIGALTGRTSRANVAAGAFQEGLDELRVRYSGAPSISVFYQVDARPLYTINGDHFVSEIIAICGGVNIFADLEGLAPLVSVEAVLARDPEVMLAGSDAGIAAFDAWTRWTDLAANRYGNRFIIPADQIGRATPRLLQATQVVCDALQTGRENRETYNK